MADASSPARAGGLLVPLALLAHAPAVPAQALDSWSAGVDAIRESFGIPGMAIAIVRGDSVLLAEGYGLRRAGATDPVDDETLFAIGSTTKAFTSTALAILVGDGALGWDDRVGDHLPGFRLADPWTTREITIRDVLGHRSGLPMANLMWLTGSHDTDELVRRLRHLEPALGFRDGLAYQNVLYAAAGSIVERATGRSWAAFVDEQILSPLGMRRTRTGVAGLSSVPNVASPHATIDGGARPVPYRDIDAVGPAGSILSSAGDMARWLRFQLADGLVDGRAVVDREALLETRRPQTVMRPDGPLAVFYPDSPSLAYGMGWVASRYRGRTLLDHAGGIDGMTALVALLPEERIGVAILANLQLEVPPYWILYPLLDVLLGVEPIDRTEPFRGLMEQVREAVAVAPPRTPDSPPSLPIEAYAGVYDHPAIGSVEVTIAGDRLAFGLGGMEAPLEPWHVDTFRADWTDRAWRAAAGPGWVTFHLDREAAAVSLELVAVPGERWRFDRRVEGAEGGR